MCEKHQKCLFVKAEHCRAIQLVIAANYLFIKTFEKAFINHNCLNFRETRRKQEAKTGSAGR